MYIQNESILRLTANFLIIANSSGDTVNTLLPCLLKDSLSVYFLICLLILNHSPPSFFLKIPCNFIS